MSSERKSLILTTETLLIPQSPRNIRDLKQTVTRRMTDITHILSAIEQGNSQAAEDLLPLVYDELRRLAAEKMLHEQPGITLQATALVHEAYVRLVDVQTPQRWQNRGYFFASAAEAMRRILIEGARRRETLKRGGDHLRIDLNEMPVAPEAPQLDVLALDEALQELEQHDSQAAQLVKLRYFAGLGHVEAAEVMGIERRAADRLWTLGRTWLFRRLSPL